MIFLNDLYVVYEMIKYKKAREDNKFILLSF